jgi:hypothetical protein
MPYVDLDVTQVGLRTLTTIPVRLVTIASRSKPIRKQKEEKEEKENLSTFGERVELGTRALFHLKYFLNPADERTARAMVWDRYRVLTDGRHGPSAQTQLTALALVLAATQRPLFGDVCLGKNDPQRFVLLSWTVHGLEATRLAFWEDEYHPHHDEATVRAVLRMLRGNKTVSRPPRGSRRFSGDLLKLLQNRQHPLRDLERQETERELTQRLRQSTG